MKMKISRLFALIGLAVASNITAKELPPFDALANTSPKAVSQTVAPAPTESSNPHHYQILLDERLGLPTFLTPSPQVIRQTNVGLVALPQNAARQYLKNVAKLYKLTPTEVDKLSTKHTQRLPNGATIVQLAPKIQGIDIFRERISVLIGMNGELQAIGGYVSGSEGIGSLPLSSLYLLPPQQAIGVALADFDFSPSSVASALQSTGEEHGYDFFSLASISSPSGKKLLAPARIKPVFFRLSTGLVPAYYLEVQVSDPSTVDSDYYAYVISAKDGKLLHRKSLKSHIQSYHYRVWADATPPFTPYPGPQGRNGTPHPTGVPDGYQGPFIAPNLVNLQNAPFSKNDPWLPDNMTITSGNNVDAYADITNPDGFSLGDTRADITTTNTFDRVYDINQSPNVSDNQRKAAITQLFYTVNWLHDWFYDAGFDEAAGNAQSNNYGRGGFQNDPLLAEAQDASGTNNANMSTPADGASPVMQMYVWDGPSNMSLTVNPGNQVFTVGSADFGPQAFTIGPVNMVLAQDAAGASTTDACEALVGPTVYANKIVLADRGNCSFVIKVKNIQNAGGIGAVIANNVAGSAPGMGGADNTITIGTLSVSQVDGNSLKQQIANGAIQATMSRSAAINRDSSLDGAIVAHEWGHYISNRLVPSLNSQMAGGLGEGWGDFHALMLMAHEQEFAFSGVYVPSAYSTAGLTPNNFYFGIRRYPYSTDFSKNPLTFKHIQDGVALPAGVPVNANGTPNSAVHNTGEIWASMLWQCYAGLLNDTPRLTFTEAQNRMKTYLVGGYKMTPADPTLVEARNALLSVMYSQDSADGQICANAFAARGAGSAAVAPDRYSTTNVGVVESFTLGPRVTIGTATIVDSPGYCDADGILDNAETGSLKVTLRNEGGANLTGATLTPSTMAQGITFPQPAITLPIILPYESKIIDVPVSMNGYNGTQPFTVTVSITAPDLSVPVTRSILISNANSDVLLNNSQNDNFEAPDLAWTSTLEQTADTTKLWYREFKVADQTHVAVGPDRGSIGITYLRSPPLQISESGPFLIAFKHRHKFEKGGDPSNSNWDGGVIELSDDNGATWIDIGNTAIPTYGGTLTAISGNPLAGRSAYVGQSLNYPAFQQVTVNPGFQYANKTVMIRFGVATDAAVGDIGWEIDDIQVLGTSNGPFPSVIQHQARCHTLTRTSGAMQSTEVLTNFSNVLQAQVKDFAGNSLSGVSVTFTAPSNGASGTFAGGLTSVTLITDANGFATAPLLAANSMAGSYTVTATAGLQSVNYWLTNLLDQIFANGFE